MLKYHIHLPYLKVHEKSSSINPSMFICRPLRWAWPGLAWPVSIGT